MANVNRLFIILVAVLTCAHAVTATARSEALSYEAVLDAGSSGTRLYLYQVQAGPNGQSISLVFYDEPRYRRG